MATQSENMSSSGKDLKARNPDGSLGRGFRLMALLGDHSKVVRLPEVLNGRDAMLGLRILAAVDVSAVACTVSSGVEEQLTLEQMEQAVLIDLRQRELTFEEACARYTQRFTMENVPSWTVYPVDAQGVEGFYEAPRFRTDLEWYEKTYFPGEMRPDGCVQKACAHSTNESWPLGRWLKEPYKIVNETCS